MSDLDAQLLKAHAEEDRPALVALYEKAAHQAREDAAVRFYLTHAYVFALEIGSPRATDLRAQLIERGAETPLHSETTNPR